MALDLINLVNVVRDDLKKVYLRNPVDIWDFPVVLVGKSTGEVNVLDGVRDGEHAVEWLRTHMQGEIETICVGRMVAKYSSVLDADGKPVIKEKAIMVMGKQLSSKRSYVSITPIIEHRDYRRDQVAEIQNKTFDPTLKGADKTRNIVDTATDRVVGHMQAKFGTEQVLDSRKGNTFLVDPIIEGVFPTPRGVEAEAAKAEDLNKANIQNAKGL